MRRIESHNPMVIRQDESRFVPLGFLIGPLIMLAIGGIAVAVHWWLS
jgi:hypothetical protein